MSRAHKTLIAVDLACMKIVFFYYFQLIFTPLRVVVVEWLPIFPYIFVVFIVLHHINTHHSHHLLYGWTSKTSKYLPFSNYRFVNMFYYTYQQTNRII